jgi:hypothetical protein
VTPTTRSQWLIMDDRVSCIMLQAPEPLWAAHQLMAPSIDPFDRPLYSYAVAGSQRPHSRTHAGRKHRHRSGAPGVLHMSGAATGLIGCVGHALKPLLSFANHARTCRQSIQPSCQSGAAT